MKTVFTKEEGVIMSSKQDFGDIKNLIDEFQYLMDTLEIMGDIDFKYFYRVTEDNYIQLAYKMDKSELELCAQYKLRHDNLKENIIFIVKENIEAHLPFIGFPIFQNSVVFTKQEFDSIINVMKDEKLAIIEQAKAYQTPLIDYLRDRKLNPRPTGYNPNSWVAKCPCGGNHQIMVSTLHDEWGCGYCNREGKILELEKWLQEIKIKEDQKRLSKMLKELKEDGKLSKQTSKWWMNRY
ncbi:hypothetical protein [Hyunsoonleella aestuarii]|uniref:Zinc finger CHC2-type domain-containing protein n=1 Tax=Hyunsoonleella aestuarii TaxID=912802 RepID=A0ABP8EE98_9FLAO|nr:hypothetical protein [Hyunsoonleella aestuarii]